MATFYIQLENRLLQISGELTTENISKALGYVPVDSSTMGNYATKDEVSDLVDMSMVEELSQRVDNITFDSLKDNPFLQDGSGELNIVDEAGNIIAKVNAEGIHSVDFIAGEHRLSNKTDKSYVDGALKNAEADLTGYVNNIDFYNIKNNPIIDGEENSLTLVDENSNIGLKVTEDGLYVKDVIAAGHILSQKADKSDIPSLDGYATEGWVVNQKYLTEHQDISHLATKDEIPSIDHLATKDEVSSIDFYNINNNPIVNNGDDKLLFVDENGYIGLQLEENGLYVKDVIADGHTLSQKADKSELSNYATKDEVSDLVDMSVVEELQGKVNTLVGEDSDKSVRTIANEELAAQLIPGNADKSLNELKEIAAWIQQHPEDASAMNKAIQANTSNITKLDSAYKEADVKVLTDANEYTDNINFYTIKDNPIVNGEAGSLTFVDEIGYIGLKVTEDGIVVKDVVTPEHKLSDKANTSDVPTKVSQLQNDANYITTADIPSLDEYVTETELSEKGYLTEHQDISHLASKEELNNLDFYSLQNNPVVNTEEGKLLFVDESGNIGLQLEADNTLYVKDVTAGSHTLSNKQDIITDLDTIRQGAAKGASALQSIPSEYVTDAELINKGYATNSYVNTELEKKQNTIADLATIRSGAALGATALQSYTEIDPVFKASAAANITTNDITNWNNKTSNSGTITGITMNGVSKGTSGVVDLGTVVTNVSNLASKTELTDAINNIDFYAIKDNPIIEEASGTLTFADPSGNIGFVFEGNSIHVLDVTTGTHTLSNKLDKLVSGTNIKTINGTSILGSGNITISGGSSITESTISGWGFTKNTGTVTGVKINGSTKNPSSGVVDLGTVPTNLASLTNDLKLLKVGSKSYNGSTEITITAADLGLSSALKYHGTTTTALTDGATTKPIVIGRSNHNQEQGCVVAYNNSSFVWDGSKWEELGNPGNYKVVQTAVSSPSASGSATSFIDTISLDANGTITATKKNILTASTSVYGITKLSSATNSASEDIAATPKAVKSAYDLASSKWTYNTDTIKAIKVNAAGTADIANSVNWINVNNKPTNLSQFNDDVVAGKYLPLTGGTITSSDGVPLNINSTAGYTIIRLQINGISHSVFGADEYWGTYLGVTGKNQKLGIKSDGTPYYNEYSLIHSGNIASQSVASAASASSLTSEYLSNLNNGGNNKLFYSGFQAANRPGDNYATGLTMYNNGLKYTYQFALDTTGDAYIRYNNNSEWQAWKQLAFTDSNVASATKLQTARTIFGQSFDGTGDVEGDSKANSFIATSSNGLRLAYGNYGTLLRNDGSGFHILLTNSGEALDGNFNTLRPFKIDLATGDIQMESNVLITKSFKLSKRLRVDARESATSFGYLKSNIANQTNTGIAHLGTNYGGTTDTTREDLDMTAISMYRGIVGIGKEYDYTSLRAIYDAGVDLGLTKGLLIGPAKVLYVNNELNISTSAYINGNVKVENGNFIGNLTGTADNSNAVNGTKIAIVSLMPSSPDSSTLYFVK